ncbi:hypothetical protein NYR55_05110 [Sphingomonas sp. BGYR3]|uniref:hypothetical protein n=1 Tax=Sphingomonas sp. BGYR3 TaxID=2975483 RepID=UPI0021A56A9F|nr:hypothetical protein [Sphingomonas sp. BGYR3]MDG5487999.1 hypothetical protein [Sphingomonas sp. BGYR3]
MEHHFDRTIRFNDQSELKNLYKWCLNEHDEAGEKVGRDYIPWQWTLHFKGKGIALSEHTQIGDRYAQPADEAGAKSKRIITATLYPAEQGRYAPRYSMLGTDRTITHFDLRIEEADGKGERCVVWGGVSYTADVDFRDVTSPDTIVFYFYLKRERFDDIARQIASRAVDSLSLSLGGVQGFYADWSPRITTDKIKVLTRNRHHEIQGAIDAVRIPRLGEVEEAELSLATKFDLALEDDYPDNEPDKADTTHGDGRPVDRPAQLEFVSDSRAQETLKMITSLRMAAWVIAGLLLIRMFV